MTRRQHDAALQIRAGRNDVASQAQESWSQCAQEMLRPGIHHPDLTALSEEAFQSQASQEVLHRQHQDKTGRACQTGK